MKNTDSQEEKIKRFKEIRKYFGLNQQDFASKIGLTQSKVSLISNGREGKNILNDIFYRLHYEFGISKDWWEEGIGNIVESPQIVDGYIAAEDAVVYGEGYWKGRYDELMERYLKLESELRALKGDS